MARKVHRNKEGKSQVTLRGIDAAADFVRREYTEKLKKIYSTQDEESDVKTETYETDEEEKKPEEKKTEEDDTEDETADDPESKNVDPKPAM